MQGKFKIVFKGFDFIKLNDNGGEEVFHSASEIFWVGDYETVVVIQRHLVAVAVGLQEEGEKILKNMKK